MIKIVLILIFMINFKLQAYDNNYLQNLSLTQDISEELKIIINHLSESSISKNKAIEVTTACKLINDDVSKIDDINLLFLIKSEIYKGLLNNQYMSYDNRLQISSVIVKSIDNKVKKYELNYSTFAKWIYRSIKNDLDPYLKNNFIDKYQTVSRTNMKEKARALNLQKSLKYISPWLIALEGKTPEDFNNLLTNISVDIINRLAKKTYFFHEFSNKYSKEKRDGLFNIPNISPVTEAVPQTEPNTLQEKQIENVEKAKKNIEELENTQDLEGSSKAVEKLLEEKVKKEEDWTPK